MTRWFAIGYGALELRNLPDAFPGVDIVVVPVVPSEPRGLGDGVADLWLRLTGVGADDQTLSKEEQILVREFADVGIATDREDHPGRIRDVSEPWLGAPLHELVYALVVSLARDLGVRTFAIKGPVLHRQGLREREHSGDVDVWVEPSKLDLLGEALTSWGWTLQPDIWSGTGVNHSVTYIPGAWGCEIDVHQHFPGIAVSETAAFEALSLKLDSERFAGVEVSVPNKAAHAVICLRPEIGHVTSEAQLREALGLLRTGGVEGLEIARSLAADAALRDCLVLAFPDEVVSPSKAPLNWRWRQQPNRAMAYCMAIRMVPVHMWPKVIFRLLWPEGNVAEASARRVGDEPMSMVRARLDRLKRGIRGTVNKY